MFGHYYHHQRPFTACFAGFASLAARSFGPGGAANPAKKGVLSCAPVVAKHRSTDAGRWGRHCCIP